MSCYDSWIDEFDKIFAEFKKFIETNKNSEANEAEMTENDKNGSEKQRKPRTNKKKEARNSDELENVPFMDRETFNTCIDPQLVPRSDPKMDKYKRDFGIKNGYISEKIPIPIWRLDLTVFLVTCYTI